MNRRNLQQNNPSVTSLNWWFAVSKIAFSKLGNSAVAAVHNVDALVKVSAVAVVLLGFTYGYLVNNVVSVTAKYSQTEAMLQDANTRLSNISERLAELESSIQVSDISVDQVSIQAEASGFVSRSANSGFSYNSSL